jgi:antitoxin MazE
MRTTIVAIGNSQGIRIPKVLLEESGIKKDVEIKPIRGGLKITPIKEASSAVAETAMLSEPVLGREWNRPEEDEAWASL